MMAALLYGALYAAAASPGLPLGFRLFGHRNPSAWVAGALMGYALTAFAIWLPIRAGFPSAIGFTGAWLLLSAATWLGLRGRSRPLVALPAWRARDTAALCFVLLLTVAIAVPPFARVGVRDGDGNQYYHAYFTADFVWHTALTAELGKYSVPPRNPYLAHKPIHYYWTYFLLPAAVSTNGPSALHDVQRCLKLNAVFSGLLFIAAIFVSARQAVPHAAAVGTSVALVLIASGAEGAYTVFDLWRRHLPLSVVRDINIDAVTAWTWGAYRIDGLPRALWYVPQHSMAGALGLVALMTVTVEGAAEPLVAPLVAGVALAGATAMNPFVGAVFALAYGSGVLVNAFRKPAAVRRVLHGAAAAIPVAAALAWCISNRMLEGAGGALEFGFAGPSLNAPVVTLLLSVGPALVPAIAGLFVRNAGPLRPLVPYIVAAAVSVFLLYFVRLSVDQAWVGFRSGHILLIVLPALIARFFVWAFRSSRWIAIAAAAAILLAGAPTTIIDEYNAHDTRNLAMGPGFPWTIVVSPAQQEALAWIRTHTPATAIVQMDPTVRERSTWSLIPSWAERRMAAGLPISLLKVPDYRAQSDRVRAMYSQADPGSAWNIAHALGINYVYLDEVERQAHGGATIFDRGPDQFEPVFRRGEVAIYRVK